MRERLHVIDKIRGITFISMIVYHFMWDLRYIAGFSMDWYTGIFCSIWQKSICMSFIFISGFCFLLGRNHLKRSLMVFLSGVLVSIVTIVFMPENRIVFGILTFIGSAGLLMILIDKLQVLIQNGNVKYVMKNKISPPMQKHDQAVKRSVNMTMFVFCIVMFIAFFNVNDGKIFGFNIPGYLYKGYVMTFIGFTDRTFYSTDYFSLIPWMFLYMCGYYFYLSLCKSTITQNDRIVLSDRAVNILTKKTEKKVYRPINNFLEFIGRHTLITYLLHQPVLYVLTIIIKFIAYR